MHNDLTKAAKFINVELPALEKASKTSEELLEKYKTLLGKEFLKDPPDNIDQTDIVFLGSIARGECSSKSDYDYYVLQNGAPPHTTRSLILSMEKILDDFESRKPGDQHVFGEIVVAANLYESIGLAPDSNANMTQRILLLSESKPITRGVTYEEVIDNILRRYCADYTTNNRHNSPAKVPRYLLNDLVRYWRTMAVDFGTKRWRDGGSYLRLAKLRITRKILFAGPLATVLLAPQEIETNDKLQSYLKESLEPPPLAQLAKHAEDLSEQSQKALKILLKNYDQFIGILSGDEREVLEGNKGNDKVREDLKKRCRVMGDNIQSGLEQIFYKDKLFKDIFQKYSVF